MKYPISEAFFRDMFINHPSSRLGMKSFSSRVWFAVSMEFYDGMPRVDSPDRK